MPNHDRPAPAGDTSATPPDYWSFVQAAQRRISQEFPDADLDANRLFLSLNRSSSTAVYDFESTIHRPAGGTWSSFRLLLALWVSGPLSPNEAARLTGMSRAAVSNLTGTLVGKGLLRREASPDDGRSVTLRLTEDGLAKIRVAFRAQNERESQWAEALTDDEQHTLVTLLEKLMEQRERIGARARR
ncbi:MarR family winged helix-turn-helix transcriptional regulator [Kocuria sp. M1R5S2]|uniref:MarR family winged helix-turn-helix transcriptional regulator n=1 Tax=Kocuria rhizosphaerae TaxID=3376285 RepID=UPI0037A21C1A